MIIVEGMDNTGKTTLIQKLAAGFNLRVVKSPGPVPAEQAYDWVSKTLDEADINPRIIYDRYHLISEQIYGPVVRGTRIYDTQNGMLLWDKFLVKMPMIIYCRPPKDVIVSFQDGRPQILPVLQNPFIFINRYDNLMFKLRDFYQEHGGFFAAYDFTADPPMLPDIIEKVMAYLKLKEAKSHEHQRCEVTPAESGGGSSEDDLRPAEGADGEVSQDRSGERSSSDGPSAG